MKKIAVLIFIILTGTISEANAQFYPDSWTLGPNWAYNRAMSDIEIARLAMQGSLYGKTGKAGNQAKSQSNKKVVATGISAFKADQPYILPKLLAENLQGTKEEQKNLQSALEAGIREYQTDAVKEGYPNNDLAFALTYYAYNNYAIFNAIKPMWVTGGQTQFVVHQAEIYTYQIKGTYGQFSRMLRSQDGLKKLTDEQKQQIAEYLAIMTTTLYHAYADVESNLKNDMREVEKIKQVAKSNLENLVGVEAEKIRINENGVVVKQ